MKIAITGSSGRIGRSIHFSLCQQHEVVSVDRVPSSATSHVGDITDYDFLTTAFKDVDAVIHTAALHSPHVGIYSEDLFHDINVRGTASVARAAIKCGVQQLVFTSTTALYGHASTHPEYAVWVNEKTIPRPRTVYHRTKLEAEALLKTYASGPMRVIVLRMSRCFPEPAPLMAVHRLHRGVDARDVAEAHRLALVKGGSPFQTYVISGTTPFDRSDSMELKHNPETVLQARCPELCRVFEMRGWSLPASIDRVYDASRAHAALGWRPRYGFDAVTTMLDMNVCEVLPARAAGAQYSE